LDRKLNIFESSNFNFYFFKQKIILLLQIGDRTEDAVINVVCVL